MSTPGRVQRLDIDERDLDRSLGRLVLLLLETLRELMERQAIRRFRSGSLDDDQAERLGNTLAALRARMSELRDVFGIDPDDDITMQRNPAGVPLRIWRNDS